MMATNLWRPCGPIRVSAPPLLARASSDALAAVLVASFGLDHLVTKSLAAPLRPDST